MLREPGARVAPFEPGYSRVVSSPPSVETGAPWRLGARQWRALGLASIPPLAEAIGGAVRATGPGEPAAAILALAPVAAAVGVWLRLETWRTPGQRHLDRWLWAGSILLTFAIYQAFILWFSLSRPVTIVNEAVVGGGCAIALVCLVVCVPRLLRDWIAGWRAKPIVTRLLTQAATWADFDWDRLPVVAEECWASDPRATERAIRGLLTSSWGGWMIVGARAAAAVPWSDAAVLRRRAETVESGDARLEETRQTGNAETEKEWRATIAEELRDAADVIDEEDRAPGSTSTPSSLPSPS